MSTNRLDLYTDGAHRSSPLRVRVLYLHSDESTRLPHERSYQVPREKVRTMCPRPDEPVGQTSPVRYPDKKSEPTGTHTTVPHRVSFEESKPCVRVPTSRSSPRTCDLRRLRQQRVQVIRLHTDEQIRPHTDGHRRVPR